VANVTASRISAEKLRRIRIFQSRTYIACDTGERKVERFRLVIGPDRKPAIQRDLLPVDDGEPLRLELQAFLASVATREPPVMTGLAGRRALELALRVRDAIATSGGA
jgi:predicted dehydrogenase